MMYTVYRSYCDGRDDNDTFFIINESNLKAFKEYLLSCGYVETPKHSFLRKIDPGWLDHHGNHYDTIWFDTDKEVNVLTEANWSNHFGPMSEDYEMVSPGYYCYSPSDDD